MTERRCPQCEAIIHIIDECYDCLCITDSKSMAKRFKGQEECRRGHKYTPENTIIEVSKGKEYNRCRICLSARRRAQYMADRMNRNAKPSEK